MALTVVTPDYEPVRFQDAIDAYVDEGALTILGPNREVLADFGHGEWWAFGELKLATEA